MTSMETKYPEIPESIRESKVITDETEAKLVKAIEEFKAENAQVIESAAKELCITQAIAEKEGITVSKADIEEYFGGQDYSGVEKIYGKNFVKFIILQSKTLDHLTATIARG